MITYRLYGKLPENGLKTILNGICKNTSEILKINEELEFDVNIVNSNKIKSINKKYRQKDKVTDVISFANRDNNGVHIPLLGEIYICLEQAKKQASDYGHSLKREISFLFTHGLLHLLGYDHMTKKDEKVMLDLTKKILKDK